MRAYSKKMAAGICVVVICYCSVTTDYNNGLLKLGTVDDVRFVRIVKNGYEMCEAAIQILIPNTDATIKDTYSKSCILIFIHNELSNFYPLSIFR